MYFARNFVPGSTARKLSGFWNGSHVDVRREEIWVTFDNDLSTLVFPRDDADAIHVFCQHYRRFKWRKRSDRKKARRFVRRALRLRADPFFKSREADREWLNLITQCVQEIRAGKHGEASRIVADLEGQARMLRAKIADPRAYRSPLYVFEDTEAP